MPFSDLTLNASLAYLDGVGAADALQVGPLSPTVATEQFHRGKQLVPTSNTAINLGGIAAPSWAIFVNLDPTNFLDLLTSTSGVIFARLLPGEVALLRLGSGAQAPAAIANTASCYLGYLIVSL